MKIDSNDTNAEKLLGGNKFLIPRFQRPYSWENSEVKDFIEDIYTDEGEEYFIGSMVMYSQGSRLAIVDGQQRLTTLVIILCALRNHFIKQKLENLANGIQQFIERINVESNLEFTLSPESSYPYFQNNIMSMGQGNPNEEPDNEEEKRIYKAYKIAYKYFLDIIKNIKQNPTIRTEDKDKHIQIQLSKLRTNLLSVKVVTITLDNEHDAYIVFETLNTRGRELSVTDLIKNHVTRRWRQENNDLDNATNSWNNIIDTLFQSKHDIKPDEFFHHQWLSKNGYTSKKALFSKFTKAIGEDHAEEYLRDTEYDSKIYRLIREPTYQGLTIQAQDKDIILSLEALNLFKVKMPYPTLLSLLRGYFSGSMKPKYVKKSFKIIEKYHFINSAITSQRSSGSTQKMYSDWAIEIVGAYNDPKSTSQIISTYEEKLKNDLAPFHEFDGYFQEIAYLDSYTKEKKLVQYILSKVHGHFNGGQPVDYQQMTVEHIIAQSLASECLANSELVGRIGNLMYVSKALNLELGNKKYPEKKKLLQGSGDLGVQNDFLHNYESWKDDDILDRGKNLSELAYNTIWKL